MKDDNMPSDRTLIAVFSDHSAADAAIKSLVEAGFSTQSLSVVGKGSRSGENTLFHGIGDRLKFWGSRSAFWGALWGLFFGGLFVAFPELGIVVVLGYLAATTISAVESESLVGGFGTLGTSLNTVGIPVESASRYETAVKADGFLVMAHGTSDEVEHAGSILVGAGATSIEVHGGLSKPPEPSYGPSSMRDET